jgi:hypothetical protein
VPPKGQNISLSASRAFEGIRQTSVSNTPRGMLAVSVITPSRSSRTRRTGRG